MHLEYEEKQNVHFFYKKLTAFFNVLKLGNCKPIYSLPGFNENLRGKSTS